VRLLRSPASKRIVGLQMRGPVGRTGKVSKHSGPHVSKLLCVSRVLLFLISVVLAIAPWTERYCALDNFPRGQDFELGLLAVLALLALVLLFAHTAAHGSGAAGEDRDWLYSVVPDDPLPRNTRQPWTAGLVHRPSLPSCALRLYNLPLQI
jgi:hypothetical protein